MNHQTSAHSAALSASSFPVKAFKYLIYILLLINTLYFFYEDFLATDHTFRNGISWTQMGDAFATFLDSFSWLILLLIFELETYVIEDRDLKGGIKYLFNGLIAVSYGFVILAFTGYMDRASTIYEFSPKDNAQVCSEINNFKSFAEDIDIYHNLTKDSCNYFDGKTVEFNEKTSMVATAETVSHMKKMAMTDVVNAGTWVLVVLVLWADIILQLAGKLTSKLYKFNMVIKSGLYSVLIICCAYWTYHGAWIDAWDSLLWILAFFVIELNLFNWYEETSDHITDNA